MNWSTELLLIDKPKGITSFDVIRRLRRLYTDTHNGERAPKMGHAGTLDPLATGLMLIGVGAGTKRLAELTKLDKDYTATVCLGESRTTGDMAGEVLEEIDVVETVEMLRSKISSALTDMCGTLTLPVSAYSAIKVGGVPMYKRARKAEKVGEQITDVPVRDMRVLSARLMNVRVANGRAYTEIEFSVGSGTYIRSLAEELGRRIGYPACLSDLRRTRVGEFVIVNATPLKT